MKGVILVFCFMLAGCASYYDFSKINKGMDKATVIEILGEPTEITTYNGMEYLNYQLFDILPETQELALAYYFVRLKDGKVDDYQRQQNRILSRSHSRNRYPGQRITSGGYGQSPILGPIQNNAYGPGVHMDQSGRPVTLAPAFSDTTINGNSYIQTPDAYGPGIHMDQYGSPVKAVPR